MASNLFRICKGSGQDVNIICGAATDEPVTPRTALPNAIHSSIPNRRRIGNTLRHCSPHRVPASHCPLSSLRIYWGPSFDNRVVDCAYDPYSAPDIRSLFSSSARDYHNGIMSPNHGRQSFRPTPQLLHSSYFESINTVDPASPSTTSDALPSLVPLSRLQGTLPAPQMVPMHAHHYHEQQYHDPTMAAHTASQGHMVPQIPALGPPPVTTVTAPGTDTKLYCCRYAKALDCKKTFTTSGHASRHSKIHTGRKSIQCAFPGCAGTFIRADNMKQHLATHSRDLRRPRLCTGSSSRGALHTNAKASAAAMRHKRRGLNRDMVRLRARQMHQVNTQEGSKVLA